jgi:hypothetical protein
MCFVAAPRSPDSALKRFKSEDLPTNDSFSACGVNTVVILCNSDEVFMLHINRPGILNVFGGTAITCEKSYI